MFGSMNIINLVNIRSMRSRTGRTFMTGRRTRQLSRKLQNTVNLEMRMGWTCSFPQFPFPVCKANDGRAGHLWSSPLARQWTIHWQSDSAAGYQHRSRHDLLMLFPLPSSLSPQCPGGVKLAPPPLLQSEPGLFWLWGDITNAENCQKCRHDGKWHNWYFRWRKNIQFEFYQQECWFKMQVISNVV